MTVHDAIPKERGLSVSFTFLCQNPASAGFLLSEPVTRMNDYPRRYTKRRRLIGQLPLQPVQAFCKAIGFSAGDQVFQRRDRGILHLMNLADDRGDAAVA
jgi:hypothetical protein